MRDIEDLISPFIESQFPSFYKEEGPHFVAFVQAYYQWLEQTKNTLGVARDLLENRDVDLTIDEFINSFKSKYLPLLSFDTATDKRFLIKHVEDLYRSKGTERSVDLLFRLVFGVPASVYFPSEDIFRLSDNTWTKPRYLEITYKNFNPNFVGKTVRGVDSGATAFCNNYTVKKINQYYVYVLYIDSIIGDFKTGEILTYEGLTEQGPFMVGSMNTLEIFAGSSEFKVGDFVDIKSINGVGGKARVANTSDITGLVSFTLEDGGWGFTSNASVYVSSKVLFVENIKTNNAPFMFIPLETIKQNQANIEYISLSGPAITNGDVITTYYGNGAVSGNGVVLSTSITNTTSGHLLVQPVSGNLQSNAKFWTSANTSSANTSSFTDKTASGKLVGVSANIVFKVDEPGSSNTIAAGYEIFQTNSLGFEIANATVFGAQFVGSNGVLTTTHANGVFTASSNLRVRTSDGFITTTNTTIQSFSTQIGVSNVSGGDFNSSTGNWLYGVDSTSYANVYQIGTGALANFSISNTLSYPESIFLYTDKLSTYANVALNALAYGFPAAPTANMSTSILLKDILSNTSITIGQITKLVSVNPGINYDYPPFVYISEPIINSLDKHDVRLGFLSSTSAFSNGEVITQSATGATGYIKHVVNSTAIDVRRTKLFTDFAAGSTIVGSSTGTSANVVTIEVLTNEFPAGFNAVVNAETQSRAGAVLNLDVIDSGYGYQDGELSSFVSADGNRSGSAYVHLITNGQGSGFFENDKSFLSADKHLFDGNYYQEYSYVVKTSKSLDKYSAILKDTIHLIGTKYFGAFVSDYEQPFINSITTDFIQTTDV